MGATILGQVGSGCIKLTEREPEVSVPASSAPPKALLEYPR